MLSAQTVARRLDRWNAFVEGGAGSFMFHVNFPMPELEAQMPPAPPLWSDRASERIERRWAEYQVMCRKAEMVNDDRVPYVSNMTGTEIFAEAFGCAVHRPEGDMPFALPAVRSAAEADRLKEPEVSASSLAYLFDMADELFRRGGPEAVMKPVDIQSPMDIVALIWDKSDLCIAMVEAPDAVKALADKVRRLLAAFFDEWFRRYGTTFVAHYPDYVMHGGITLSVDEVGACSPAMFREFFRPELVSLSDRFGGLGIHCCADARHQWGNFRDIPGLKVMNHNAPPTRDARRYLLDSVGFYGHAIAQMPIGWTPEGDPETWPKQFPAGSRVILEAPADGVASAAAIADRLQALRERLESAG